MTKTLPTFTHSHLRADHCVTEVHAVLHLPIKPVSLRLASPEIKKTCFYAASQRKRVLNAYRCYMGETRGVPHFAPFIILFAREALTAHLQTRDESTPGNGYQQLANEHLRVLKRVGRSDARQKPPGGQSGAQRGCLEGNRSVQ